MSLRPRYSLLTLLLLTAVVAIGVKLWHGPHHVVERISPTLEEEYTFTRDWSGSKIIRGVKISRYEMDSGTKQRIDFDYFRQGENTHRTKWIYVDLPQQKYLVGLWLELPDQTKLTREERREVECARQDEGERLRRQGLHESEDDSEFDWFLGSAK